MLQLSEPTVRPQDVVKRARPRTRLLTSMQQKFALVQETETHFAMSYLHKVRSNWGAEKPCSALSIREPAEDV